LIFLSYDHETVFGRNGIVSNVMVVSRQRYNLDERTLHETISYRWTGVLLAPPIDTSRYPSVSHSLADREFAADNIDLCFCQLHLNPSFSVHN
jgi:hypothetical protein